MNRPLNGFSQPSWFANNTPVGNTGGGFPSWGVGNGGVQPPVATSPLFPTGSSAYAPGLGQGVTATPGSVAGGGFWDMFKGAFQGQEGANGTFGASPALQGVQALSGLANIWQGMEGLDLAKDTFNFQKDAFNKNFANQVQTTNTQLADREARRVAARGQTGDQAYASVQNYLDKNAVKA